MRPSRALTTAVSVSALASLRRDVGRAHRVSSQIRSGIVWVNTYRAISPIAPFGGFKDSGYGREAGIDVIQDYTRSRTVWINTSSDPMADPFIMR